jgi:DNA-binding CsgD family transcriptional regulator
VARDQALLEREREMAAIDAALGAAVAGRGGALAVEGEAGLGKTRLLAEARGLALEAGAETLGARATELEGDFPFAVARQLLEPRLRRLSADDREALLDGAGAALGALGLAADRDRSGDTFSVLHALYWVIAGLAEQGPFLLAIDDAHLADHASLDWLAFMLPRLEELPVLLMVARRTDEPESPGLARILADPSLETVSPAPLSAAATATLIEARLGRQADDSFAAVCHEITAGNPFLVTELARELAERAIEPRAEERDSARGLAPQRLAQMVLDRISRLSPDAAALARAVAVIGEAGEPALVFELAGLDPEAGREAADALRRAAILDPGETLRFIHPLVRNAVYAELAAGERGKAHTTAAELLRERGAPPEWVATQLLASEARGDRTAVETLLEAGRRGLADGAPRSAVAYLTRALREPPPADLRIEVLKALLPAALRAADHSVLATIETELRTVLEREPSSAGELAAPLTMGMALGGRLAEAADALQEAIRTAAAERDVESLFQLEAQLRTVAMLMPGLPEVDLQQYADEVEPDSPAGRLAAAIEARATVGTVDEGSARDAADAATRALANDCVMFEEEPEIASAAAAVLILAIAGELEGAGKAAERALEIARERDAAPDISRALFLRGFVAWSYGDLVAAESDVRQAVELARLAELLPMQLMFAGPLAEVLIERDELDAAEAVMAEAGVGADPLPPSGLFPFLMLARGHLRVERGEVSEGAEDFAALAQLGENLGLGPGPMVLGGSFAARALAAAGRADEARELADPCLYWARRWGEPATVSAGLRAVAAARGGEEQVELLREAVAVLDDSPRRLQRTHALVELGAALRRRNRRADARAPLREGLELARRCGAVRLAKRAREELQATGETVRRFAPIGVESLTPSERRVAEMAASGMTNRQIAQSLFVTLKTVEAHLSAAYDKLDISSRGELPSALSKSPAAETD